MSYQGAAALQTAVFGVLSTAPALGGMSIVDAMPAGASLGSFVLIGPEQVIDQSDKTALGAEHRFEVSVISDATGFMAAKQAAAANKPKPAAKKAAPKAAAKTAAKPAAKPAAKKPARKS